MNAKQIFKIFKNSNSEEEDFAKNESLTLKYSVALHKIAATKATMTVKEMKEDVTYVYEGIFFEAIGVARKALNIRDNQTYHDAVQERFDYILNFESKANN